MGGFSTWRVALIFLPTNIIMASIIMTVIIIPRAGWKPLEKHFRRTNGAGNDGTVPNKLLACNRLRKDRSIEFFGMSCSLHSV